MVGRVTPNSSAICWTVSELKVDLVWLVQTAAEAEVDAFLGRARYQRAATVTATATGGDEEAPVRPGYRNGHCPTTVKTTSGPITIARPKLRGTTEKSASRLFGAGVTRTHALETLVIASFVRGLSVRDVEGTPADALGPEAALSKSTVSTICQAIVAEYDAWCRRDLSTVELDYQARCRPETSIQKVAAVHRRPVRDLGRESGVNAVSAAP